MPKPYSMLASILGSPYFGKVPNTVQALGFSSYWALGIQETKETIPTNTRRGVGLRFRHISELPKKLDSLFGGVPRIVIPVFSGCIRGGLHSWKPSTRFYENSWEFLKT